MIISKVKLDLFAKVSYRGQLEDEDVPLTRGTSPNTNITGKTVDAANNILSKVGVGGLAGYRPASNTGSYSSSTNVSSPFSTTQSEKDAYFSGSPSPTKFNWQDQDPADLATLGQSLANSVQQSWQGGQDVGTAASGLPVKNWVSEIADVISGQKAPTQEQLLQAQLQQWQESYEALAAQMAAMQGNMPNLDDILDYINKATYAEAPVLNDRFDATKVALADAALGMNYEDWLGSDQYSALARRYGLQGNQAMRDTLAQVASRTGGLASSYAQSAAQQQYNNYMAQLESAAQNQFGLEKNRALDDARAAFDFSDSDYERYLQDLAQYNQDRSFGMQTLQNALNEYWNQNDWNFKQMQYANDLQQQEYDRMLQQQQWNTDQDWKAKQWEQSLLEYQDSKDADARKEAQDQINMILMSGGSLSDIPADLIEQSGWGTATLTAAERTAQQAIADAKKTGRSSGSRSSSKTKPSLTYAQYTKRIEEAIKAGRRPSDADIAGYEYYAGEGAFDYDFGLSITDDFGEERTIPVVGNDGTVDWLTPTTAAKYVEDGTFSVYEDEDGMWLSPVGGSYSGGSGRVKMKK